MNLNVEEIIKIISLLFIMKIIIKYNKFTRTYFVSDFQLDETTFYFSTNCGFFQYY